MLEEDFILAIQCSLTVHIDDATQTHGSGCKGRCNAPHHCSEEILSSSSGGKPSRQLRGEKGSQLRKGHSYNHT